MLGVYDGGKLRYVGHTGTGFSDEMLKDILKRKRSTNPIWRLAPVFGQLGSCNWETNLVIIDAGAAGMKSDGWSMNLKRADRKERSSAEAAVWH